MQTIHQRCVLRFRVTDDDIIIGKQKAVGNLTLGAERLTGTRRTQNQAVGVFQQLSIHHDEVVGQGIDAVVQASLPFWNNSCVVNGTKIAVELVVSPR